MEHYNVKTPLDKYAKAVNSSAIMPVSNKQDIVKHNDKYEQLVLNFWKNNNVDSLGEYIKGKTVSGFNSRTKDIRDVLSSIQMCIKEAIMSELSRIDETGEDCNIPFNIIESSYNMISDIIKPNKEFDIKNILAYLHGYINSYVNQTIIKEH